MQKEKTWRRYAIKCRQYQVGSEKACGKKQAFSQSIILQLTFA
jgi:hypothetical protein